MNFKTLGMWALLFVSWAVGWGFMIVRVIHPEREYASYGMLVGAAGVTVWIVLKVVLAARADE